MPASLYSPLWYRVSAQQPHLASDVIVRQANSRGQAWCTLRSTSTGRQCRINGSAYQFVGRCDGLHSVQAIWDALLVDLRDDAPTQDEVIHVLGRLAAQGFLEYDTLPDIELQSERRAQRVARRRRGNLNPLAFRVPLGDPTTLLQRLDGLHRWLFHPLALVFWLVTMALAAAVAATHWSALSAHAAAYMSTPHYLLLSWLSFPFIKLVHELGHGLAVRHWGGEVHEAGISLFVLTPAPYVDASASAAFHRRYQRAGVAAIGIMVELVLAAVALMVWLNVQPGLVRDLAFVSMFVASASTLLFNANPLLKFDGYYVLCDALDVPNLGVRSQNYWLHVLQRCVFGDRQVTPLEFAPGEQKWLAVYAPLSFGYRLVLSGLIVLWVGHHSSTLGAILAAYVAYTALLMPAVRTLRGVLAAAPHGLRSRTVLGVAAAAVGLIVFAVPLPFHTAAPGVVWLPDQALARPDTDGFVTRFDAHDGAYVMPGELLLTLEDPALLAQRDVLAAELLRLRAERFDALRSDPARAGDLQEDVLRVEGEQRRIEERISKLELRSQVAGTLVMPRQQDLLGSFVRRGTTLGYVLDDAEVSVRAAVPERDAGLIRQGEGAVEVRLAEAISETLPARMKRDLPSADFALPSAALGDRGGGPYMTDPSDSDGLRSMEPVVLIDLVLPGRSLERIGGRAWVRFDHGAQPLVVQAWRRLRQLFLQHFNPIA